MKALSRREWVMLAAVAGRSLQAGKHMLGRQPEISVQDFAQYPAVITPNGDFFVRDHFNRPVRDSSQWTIQVKGLVRRPGALKLTEALGGEKRSIVSVLE